MGVDRRSFGLGLVAALAGACRGGTVSLAQSPDGWWNQYRARFVAPDGRVVDTGNGGISHSEGQGYGMLLAVQAGDRDTFERIARWTDARLARRDLALHAWRFDPRAAEPVSDFNNATDGDILIAWALALAGRDWDQATWLGRSAAIRAAIRSECVTDRFGYALLLPGRAGFAAADRIEINPSYYIWPALDLFARLDGAPAWGPVIDAGEALLARAKFGAERLPTDWVAVTGRDALAPAPGRPPRFGFDAIRVPLYAALGGRAWLVGDIARFWRERLAEHGAIPAWIDVVSGETANFPASPGGMAIAQRLLGNPAPLVLASDYYAASLQLLARVRA